VLLTSTRLWIVSLNRSGQLSVAQEPLRNAPSFIQQSNLQNISAALCEHDIFFRYDDCKRALNLPDLDISSLNQCRIFHVSMKLDDIFVILNSSAQRSSTDVDIYHVNCQRQSQSKFSHFALSEFLPSLTASITAAALVMVNCDQKLSIRNQLSSYLLFVATADSALSCYKHRKLVSQYKFDSNILHVHNDDTPVDFEDLSAASDMTPVNISQSPTFCRDHLHRQFRPQLQSVLSNSTLAVLNFVGDQCIVRSFAAALRRAPLHPQTYELLISQTPASVDQSVLSDSACVCEYECADDGSMRVSRVHRRWKLDAVSQSQTVVEPVKQPSSNGYQIVLKSLEKRVEEAHQNWIENQEIYQEKRRLIATLVDKIQKLINPDICLPPRTTLPAFSDTFTRPSTHQPAFDLIRLDSYYECEARIWAISACIDVLRPIDEVQICMLHSSHSVTSRSKMLFSLSPSAEHSMLSMVCSSESLPYEDDLQLMMSFVEPSKPNFTQFVRLAKVRLTRKGGHRMTPVLPLFSTKSVPPLDLHNISPEAAHYLPIKIDISKKPFWFEEGLPELLQSMGLHPDSDQPACKHWISRIPDLNKPASSFQSFQPCSYISCTVELDESNILMLTLRTLSTAVLERFLSALLEALPGDIEYELQHPLNHDLAELMHRSIQALVGELSASVDSITALLSRFANKREQLSSKGLPSKASLDSLDQETLNEYLQMIQQLLPLQNKTDALFGVLLSYVSDKPSKAESTESSLRRNRE
jgi:hypothetical protein